MQPADIHAISVTVEVDGRVRLFVMLAADGGVQRMGDGALGDDELVLTSSRVGGEAAFAALRDRIPASLLERSRVMEDPEPVGMPCRLTIALAVAGHSLSTEYRYGSRSVGPPDELVNVALAARDLTAAWHSPREAQGAAAP